MDKFNIIVLAKQVPDTRQVGKDAMNADGTINRAALPAVFEGQQRASHRKPSPISTAMRENSSSERTISSGSSRAMAALIARRCWR